MTDTMTIAAPLIHGYTALAGYLHVSRRTAHRYVAAGRMPAPLRLTRKSYYWTAAEVDAAIARPPGSGVARVQWQGARSACGLYEIVRLPSKRALLVCRGCVDGDGRTMVLELPSVREAKATAERFEVATDYDGDTWVEVEAVPT